MKIEVNSHRKTLRLTELIGLLPDRLGSQNWLREFQRGLQCLAADVDRVIISIDLVAKILQQNENPAGPSIMYSRHGGKDFAKFAPLQNFEQRCRSNRLIETLNEWGLDFSLYYPPVVQEYYSRNEYVGSIVLLRSLEYPPISNRTLATLGRLAPFLSYMLSNCIVRSRFEFPETRVVNAIIDQIQEASRYSDQDTSILTLLLYGYSYKEAAASLDISIDTVKKHVKKIYSHERVGSLSELWAKYITFQESSEIKQQKNPERANVSRGKGTQRGTVPEPSNAVHLQQ